MPIAIPVLGINLCELFDVITPILFRRKRAKRCDVRRVSLVFDLTDGCVLVECNLQHLCAYPSFTAGDRHDLAFGPHLVPMLPIALEYVNCRAHAQGEPPLTLLFIHVGDSGAAELRIGVGARCGRACAGIVASCRILGDGKVYQVLIELVLMVKDVSHLFNHEHAVGRIHFQLSGEQINQTSHQLCHFLLRRHRLNLTITNPLAQLLEEFSVEKLSLLLCEGASFCDDLGAEDVDHADDLVESFD